MINKYIPYTARKSYDIPYRTFASCMVLLLIYTELSAVQIYSKWTYRHYASAQRICDVNFGFDIVASFDQCLISLSPYTGLAHRMLIKP